MLLRKPFPAPWAVAQPSAVVDTIGTALLLLDVGSSSTRSACARSACSLAAFRERRQLALGGWWPAAGRSDFSLAGAWLLRCFLRCRCFVSLLLKATVRFSACTAR
jgi:hypothetical protein